MNNKKAAILLIGNEILSGSTPDANLTYLASALAELGIRLVEVRVVEDDYDAIIEAVNHLRARYDYLFTTGGIGPTHDDITAEAIARAFGRQLVLDQRALELMNEFYRGRGPMNSGRQKMAMLPEGAELILNNVSAAPGFRLDNVFIMAGVPKIMQDMFANLRPTLASSDPIVASKLLVFSGESSISEQLTALQDATPEVAIGSYPKRSDELGLHTELVFRSQDQAANNAARERFATILQQSGVDYRHV